MAVRLNNTFQELLSKMLSSISEMKQAPDADLEWIVGLETMVLGKLREPIDRMQQMQQQMGQQQAPGDLAGLGAMPGGGMPAQMGTSTLGPGGPQVGAVPGVMNMAPGPNPDELRRLLGQ